MIMTPPKKPLRGRVASLSIRGFRSLACLDTLPLPPLAVLIGANGSGKSNLIRFFELLGWMLRSQHLQEFIERQGGADDQLFMGAKRTPRLEAELGIATEAGLNEYRFALTPAAGDRLVLVEEAYRFSRLDRAGRNTWTELPMPAREARLVEQAGEDRTASVIVRLLRNCVTYQFHDTSAGAAIKRPWDVTDAAYLRSDGGNLSAVLYRLREHEPKRYRLVVAQIQRLLPAFEDFELTPVYDKVALRWRVRGSDKTFGAHLTSDGSLRLFCLMTLVNLPEDMLPDVVLFDEPELGLHPQAIGLLAAMIKCLAQDRQVVLATQSPLLVDCFALENMLVAELDCTGATQVRTLAREAYQRWLDDHNDKPRPSGWGL